MDQVIYYFAYGMLTDPDIMPNAEFIGAASLNGFELEFNAFANVFKSPGNRVLGSLWAIDQDTLDYLDDIEGYPTFYVRLNVHVRCDGKMYPAQVYSMTADSRETLEGRMPGEQYIQRLINGYRHAGIPLSQIRRALPKVLRQ
jgi:gamma-glutamylcyclotransferase (GGCT)/AIG2-like uncharacterized protein YtfP